ncbi:4'-phosphopantetheinyl transferase family protein [Rheinheimera maricola]|nr:hypothetical protein [Rheinheimera maricola]
MIWLGYRLQLRPKAQCRSSLTDTEWQYANSLSTKRSLQFCNGRALARQLLLRYQGVSPANADISLPSDAAPALKVCSELWQLSISHSAQAIAVAVSRTNKLGLDIEQLKPRNTDDFSREYPALTGATDQLAFYQRWTAAEAYSKYSAVPLLQVLRHSLPADLPTHYLPLNGFMLCLTYQHADAGLTITEDL